MFKKLVLPFMITLFVSCGGNENAPAAEEVKSTKTVAKDEKTNLTTVIKDLEGQLKDDVSLDTALAKRIIYTYLRYADKFPKDSLAPVYLSRSADIMKEQRAYQLKSINTYNRILVEYPEHPLAARAVFMMGFVWDSKYHDVKRATKSYDFFLEKYPQHALAKDALNLRNLLQSENGEEEKVKEWVSQKGQ